MLTFGVILLVLGWLLGIGVLWVIGAVLTVIGLILLIMGAIGHSIGGQRYWY